MLILINRILEEFTLNCQRMLPRSVLLRFLRSAQVLQLNYRSIQTPRKETCQRLPISRATLKIPNRLEEETIRKKELRANWLIMVMTGSIVNFCKMKLASNKTKTNSRQRVFAAEMHSHLNRTPQLSKGSKTLKFILRGDLILYKVCNASISLTYKSCINSCLHNFNQ